MQHLGNNEHRARRGRAMSSPGTTAAFQAARQLHEAGRFEDASKKYRSVLRQQPRHLDALHLLGVARLEAGDYAEATELIGRAIKLGLDQPEVHNHLGITLLRSGNATRALGCFEAALDLRRDFIEAQSNRAACLLALGRNAEAAEQLDSALTSREDFPMAQKQMGIALTGLGDLQGALRAFERATELEPEDAELRFLLANTQKSLGQQRSALGNYREAIRLAPTLVPAYLNLGNLCTELGHFDVAIKTYSHLIKIDASCASAHVSRGTAFLRINLLDEAQADFEKAVALDPQSALAQANHAACQSLCGNHAQAQRSLARATQLDPANPRLTYNKALLELLLGDYESGWSSYEVRHKVHRRGVIASADRRWTGREPLSGKTLLLHAEQGLGDTIQFCRYASLAASRGGRVILLVPRPLKRILETLAGVAQVMCEGETVPSYDYHCPLLSLPGAFGTTLQTIPAQHRYLSADAKAAMAWKHKLPDNGRLRVGLVWNGGLRLDKPDHWGTNERRNIPLETFIGLLSKDHDFYSLQKGEPAESEFRSNRQRLWPHPNLLDFTGELGDFADTAALIENLDLVISVDTSTAHLAAALGKPVWLLNRHDTCWRWLLTRTDSPWYPTLRIFRQERIGHWDAVVEEIAACLRDLRASGNEPEQANGAWLPRPGTKPV